MKVCVLGAAGGIGQSLSLLLKTSLPSGSSLALYDIAPFTPGIGVDLSHIPTNCEVSWFKGNMLDQALANADIVIISAGVPRKPGMIRDDLFNTNASIIKSLIKSVASICPNAFIEVVTNPLNSMVPLAAEVLKNAGCYNPKRLFGVTTLDIIRANQIVAQSKDLDPSKLDIRVIGGHSGLTILPLLSQIDGIKLSKEEAIDLIEKIQNAGNDVVAAKDGAGSATLATAYAVCRFTLSLMRGLAGETIIECAYIDQESDANQFFALPVQLGRNGLEKVHNYGKLSEYETQCLANLRDTLKANITKGINYANMQISLVG